MISTTTYNNKKRKNFDMMSSKLLLPSDFTPTASDILCGRGNIFANHEGNKYFNSFVRTGLEDYRKATNRHEKVHVVHQVLSQIREAGLRFLKQKLDGPTQRWYELTDVQAHQKIGHAIRDTIRMLKSRRSSSSDDKHKIPSSKAKIVSLKRKRPSFTFVLPEDRLLKKKTLNHILDMSLQTIEGDWKAPDDWNIPQEVFSSARGEVDNDTEPIMVTPPPSPPLARTTSIGPLLLEEEFPEHSFDFSPSSFFLPPIPSIQ